jgi:type II secretory pathway pseudopilin PulG
MVEILLVMSIFAAMTALATVSLGNFQHKTQINAAVNSLVTDLREQQVKAMVGDTEGSAIPSDYGVHFSSTNYTLYRASYGTSDFVINLPSTLTVTLASPSSELVFLKGSGEIPGHTDISAVVTLQDTVDGNRKRIIINRYGVVTAIELVP